MARRFFLAALRVLLLLRRSRRARYRRVGVHETLRSRETTGQYVSLFLKLKNDPQRFRQHTRLSLEEFRILLEKVSPR